MSENCLQLLRTKKDKDNLTGIQSIILKEGEPFLIMLDKLIDSDLTENEDHALLFTGDGSHTIQEMYDSEKYVIISNKSEINADRIFGRLVVTNLPEDYESWQTDVNQALDSMEDSQREEFKVLSEDINLSKTYSVDCNTQSLVQDKLVEISNFPVIYVKDNQGNDTDQINLNAYNNVTLIVRFLDKNSVDNPNLIVKSKNTATSQVIEVIPSTPLMINDTNINGIYNWRTGDSLVFTYKYDSVNQVGSWKMAGTSAYHLLAKWCTDNDTTMINGGMIATGTITSDQIMSGSITSDCIASGSLDASVLSSQFKNALDNLKTIEQQASSSKQVICVCNTPSGVNPKEVYLEGDDALAVAIGEGNEPIPGTTLVIKFMYPNTLGTYGSTTTSLKVMLDTIPFPSGVGNGYSIVTYKDNISEDVKNDTFLNWSSDNPDDNIRTLIFNGSEWEVQPTNVDLLRAARWCYDHDQTYIQGGNIVSGRIFADQITAGSLNIGNINLYSSDGDGRTVATLERYYGDSDGEMTYGMMMAGSDKDHFRFITTNRGVRMTGGNGGNIYSYGGVTTDENGNYVDSTGGFCGIDHNRRIRIGHNNSGELTSEIYLKANKIYFECNQIFYRKPGSSSWRATGTPNALWVEPPTVN